MMKLFLLSVMLISVWFRCKPLRSHFWIRLLTKKVKSRKRNIVTRHKFDHVAAQRAVRRDFLSANPSCKEFSSIYRISKARFQRMLEDFSRTDIKFYHPKYGTSIEVRLLHPLKRLAFGEARHQSAAYFQLSATFARQCCLEFDAAFKQLYLSEYLRLPDASDLRNIVTMHEAVHGVPGMFGLLDCWHTHWKNCPKAWQGSYKNGKEKKPTLKMEALCDHHLWFWHASYGHPGTMNDLNILDRSTLVRSFADGSFAALEAEAGVVPYEIAGREFSSLFVADRVMDGDVYARYDPSNSLDDCYKDLEATILCFKRVEIHRCRSRLWIGLYILRGLQTDCFVNI